MTERLLYSPVEVAEAINVSRAKAYELIARKVIPSIKVGGTMIRVPHTALQDWIAKQLADSTGEAA